MFGILYLNQGALFGSIWLSQTYLIIKLWKLLHNRCHILRVMETTRICLSLHLLCSHAISLLRKNMSVSKNVVHPPTHGFFITYHLISKYILSAIRKRNCLGGSPIGQRPCVGQASACNRPFPQAAAGLFSNFLKTWGRRSSNMWVRSKDFLLCFCFFFFPFL